MLIHIVPYSTAQLHRDLLVTLAKLDPFISVQAPEVDGKKGAPSVSFHIDRSLDPFPALRRSKTFLGGTPIARAYVFCCCVSDTRSPPALLSASDLDQTETTDAALRESLKKRMDFTHSVMEKVETFAPSFAARERR